jgi:YfiH family protein
VRCTFTDRLAGFSSAPFDRGNLALHVGDDPEVVASNRALVVKEFAHLAFMSQVHGNTVVQVDAHSPAPEADALITTTRGISLVVLVADCIPLLLWDESESVIAAVHVGRRGLANEVALKTITAMRSLTDSKILAVMGPSICGNCYEVDEGTYNEVTRQIPESAAKTKSGTLELVLPRGLQVQLAAVGVELENKAACTLEDERYFSYRRVRITGRQAGIITL